MLESFVSDAFEYKKLTEAEQKSRGILGRLVGVIADTQKPTRNGRKYSEKLWENVFENPIMKEKIANRCCFGELNHPADRSEVDLERVAICLAEYPKKDANGRLHGVFDILSTPNGRILKALCDYGCKIGISSRGQGDLLTDDNGDEEVDPDTYDCECFDAVIVPGVEFARLKFVTESLEKNREKSLTSVLTEELATATSDARKIMEETLDMLEIKLTEADEKSTNNIESESEIDTLDSAQDDELIAFESDTEESENSLIDTEDEDIEDTESTDADSETDERTDEQIFLDFLASNFDDKQIKKVCKILDIEVEDDDESEDDEDTESDDSEDAATDEETDDVSSDDNIDETDDTQAEAEEEIDEAIDSGSEFLVSSLKEALTKTADLESSVKTLQEALAVRDAEVTGLQEECDRYKQSITRLSTVAKSAKDLRESVLSLEQQISDKDQLVKSQKERIERLLEDHQLHAEKSKEITTLTESLDSAKNAYGNEIKTLNEKLTTVTAEAENSRKKLNEDLTKANILKEGYKKLANSAINKYIEVKADILGLTPRDIKRKLGESYTMADIDQVCEDLKSYNLNVSKLPFSVNRKVSVKVNESVNQNSIASKPVVFDDDEVSSTLMKLADFDD